MLRFHKRYFLLACLLFIIEVLIALFIKDRFIRPYFGDFLVVFLLYYFLRAFVDIPAWKAALAVLLFAYLVEILQYFKIVELLGLKGVRLAEVVIGTGFSWWDMLAYSLGVAVVYYLDKRFTA